MSLKGLGNFISFVWKANIYIILLPKDIKVRNMGDLKHIL
jgi:hypothetical protein